MVSIGNTTIIIVLLCLVCSSGFGQDSIPERTWSTTTVAGVTAATLGGSFILLDKAWYDNYERSGFHFFNDGDEWLQVDKVGHVFSSYTIGRYGHDAFRFAGLDKKQSIWIGGNIGLLYLTSIEILDGTSAEWGFSIWDMASNVGGTALFITQQLTWGEQRILPKFSAHLTDYASQRPDVLGSGLAERVFKDYNGQSYWLSYSPWYNNSQNRFLRTGVLCVSLGYGASGMLSARDNADLEGVLEDGRYRRYFLSLDIDLTKIRTDSKFLRTMFNVLNGVKIPAPTLEFNDRGDLLFRGIYF